MEICPVLTLILLGFIIVRPNSWTKSRQSLNSFPPGYSPLQFCLEISIYSDSRNLLQFLQFSYCTL
jgi:hypothetical protein